MPTLTVTKRDGTGKPFNFVRVRVALAFASQGLPVDPAEGEVAAELPNRGCHRLPAAPATPPNAGRNRTTHIPLKAGFLYAGGHRWSAPSRGVLIKKASCWR